MEYDAVIATRNRAEVLKISIPLILEQSRPPRKLIVVDSSDNHNVVRRTVQFITSGSKVDLEILHSQRACSAHQRNLGIERVESPVVMFPDDDSFWWPGVGEAIMRIYERDTNGDIGGVCAREITVPPPSVHLDDGKIYKMTLADRIRQKIGRPRHIFDDFVCPDPLWIHGRTRWTVRPVPDWLNEENAALVEFSGAARMSLRVEIIRNDGFDEDLGLYTGWAAYEDADISFKVMRNHLFVGARNARAYHHRCPGQRSGGFKIGFLTQFNRAYVICRYSPPGSRARRALKRFAIYKMMQYLLDFRSQFGRDRVRGVFKAIKGIKILLKTPSEHLRECYLELSQKAISQDSLDR
jgi:glycosyltransferase involved in cell wall biosynthesis